MCDNCNCYDCVEGKLGRKGGCSSGGGAMDAAASWRGAFQEAYKEVQVDIFKKKIHAVMGKTMDKVAAVALDAILEEIRDRKQRTPAQKTAKEKLEKLLKEASDI